MKKTVKFFFRGLLVLALFIVVLFSAAALRLLYSPIGVPYATEMVESEAQRLMPGWDVSFESAEVGWGWSDVRPWVRVENVTVRDPDGKIDALVDHAWLAISRRDILTATLTMRAIKLDGIHLQVINGAATSNFWSSIDTTQGPKALAPLVEKFFNYTGQLNKGMMRINNVSMSNLDANIKDVQGKSLLNLNIPTIAFHTNPGEVKLSINGYAQSGDSKIDVRATAYGDTRAKKLSLEWDSDPVNLKDFTALFKVPAAVGYIDAPVAVAISLAADVKDGLLTSDIYIDVGKGQLSDTQAYPVAAEIEYITAEAEYDLESNHFHVNKLSSKIKDYELNGEALVYFEQGVARPGIKGNLKLSGLTIPELKVYWPNIGRNTAKKWVDANMTTGTISDVNFLLDVAPDGVGPYRDGSIYDLTFKFRGLDAKYNKTLPIITEAEGYSRLTNKQFDLTVDSAMVDGMELGSSTFVVHDIHKRGEAYSITDVHLAAPVEDLLHFTAFAPISLNDRLKIAPERIKGYAITDTHITIPMVKGIKLNDIEFETRVQGSDVEVHDLLGGEGIRRGTVDLTVDKRGLQASGDIHFNGVAMHAKWSEDFVKGKVEGEDTTTFNLSGDMDANDLQAFNVDISSFLDGKVPVEATFTGRKLLITQGHFTANATPAVVNVSQMEWHKIAGRPVVISGSMSFSPQEVIISPLRAQGPDIDLTADLNFGIGENDHFKAGFNVKKLDANQFTASLKREGSGPYQADIVAKEMDVRPFLGIKSEEEKKANPVVKSVATHITLKADEAHFLNGIDATDLTLQSTFTEDGPQESKARATFKSGQNIDLTINIEENGERSLWMETEDAGAFLSGSGLFAHGLGGKMEFNGLIGGWGKTLEIGGTAHAEKMKVIPVSMLDEQTTIGVITGIDEIVGGKGTNFDRLVIPFSYDKGLLDLNGLRASGGDIGLTLEGQVDYNSNKINMNGVYVPVYGLNSAIGSIPIIGSILTGGKGQGIFGIAYRVKGMIDNPTVSINPLSGIAPGIFRRIFEGSKGKVSDVKDAKPKEPEQPVDERQPVD